MGVYRHCQIFLVPTTIFGASKAMNFKFGMHFNTIDLNKCPLTISGNAAVTSRGLPKIFRTSIYRAHHAVFFAIAGLSCYSCCHLQQK